MEWYLLLVIFFGGLALLMATGLPVAFCFIIINVIGAVILWGGGVGLVQVQRSILNSVTTFSFMPIPLFILMGEVLFHSGIGSRIIEVVDKWLGRLPGRLGLVAVGSGTIMAALSGSTLGTAAMLGALLVPEMERRGHKKSMSLGPILGSACLAAIIPPSILAVILGGLGYMSIGKLLIAGVMPGLVMAFLFASYIIIRCWLQPSIAPPYQPDRIPPLSEKLMGIVRYVLPLGFIMFLVTGSILVGLATPSEAAALGALGAFILAFFYRGLNWEMVKKSLLGTVSISVMVLMIIVGSSVYSALLSFSGAGRGLTEMAAGLPVAPILILIAMQVVLLVLGCFIDAVSIFMITVPIFMPITIAMGFDPVWVGILILINVTFGALTPPFGLLLFVMKGVAPPDTTMGDIIRAALPFLGIALLTIVLLFIFPQLALWLPGLLY